MRSRPSGDGGNRPNDRLEILNLETEMERQYLLQEMDLSPNDSVHISLGEQQLPQEFGLEQNYPNPFNTATNIAFELPEPTVIRLELYNMLGQRVATIEQGMFEAGRHSVVLDGSHLSSGVYVYRLQAGTFTQSRKLLLLK